MKLSNFLIILYNNILYKIHIYCIIMNKINILSQKLGVKKWKINKQTLKYYHTKQPELCCKYNRIPIDNVDPYEFHKAISILNDYYKDIKCDYYTKLYDASINLGEDILDIKPNQTLDHIILNYIKFRPNTYVITLWPNAQGKLIELKELLAKHGHVYYVRKFNLSYNAAKNLIYQMYGDMYRLSTVDKIEEKVEYLGWKKDEIKSFKIVIYDHHDSNIKISGSKSPFKTQIRNIWVLEHKDMRGDDFVHVNDNYYQTVEYCQLFFVRNSLIALNFQNLEKHLDKNMEKCRIYVNTIKKWIVENVHPIDMERFLFFGSTILYTYGIRVCRDVDGLVGHIPIKSKTDYLAGKIVKYFYNRKTKFFFGDLGMKGTKAWDDKWDQKDKAWFKLMKIEDRDEMIYDPKNYYYYNGLKLLTLKNNAMKNMVRRNYHDYGDLIQIEHTTNLEIDYPPVPEKYTKKKFIELIKKYMTEKYPDNNTYMDKVEAFDFISDK